MISAIAEQRRIAESLKAENEALQQQLAAAREALQAAEALPVCSADGLAWAIVRPVEEGGKVELVSIRGSELACQWSIGNWPQMQADGFRCIPVSIYPESSCTCPSGDGSLRWPRPSHPPSADTNVTAVHRKLDERSAKGVCEYGVTTDGAGLGSLEWMKHLQEELIDGAVYVEAALATLQRDRQP